MELRCPNCGSTDLKKVSLVYEEGSSLIKAKSRLRGLSFGDDGPTVFVGTAETKGIAQTQLSKRLRPPKKWSYLKLSGWFGLGLLVSLIVYVHRVVASKSVVDSVRGEFFFALLGGAFFVFVIAFWRHNHFSYPRAYETWDRSFVCLRCGSTSD
jgi:hypothetical protein